MRLEFTRVGLLVELRPRSKFELQLYYYVHFQTNTLGKGMNPLILLVMDLILSLLFFCKDGFGIKYPTKFDMPLNKETESKPLLVGQH